MKVAKILAILLCSYIGIVVAFESLIGFFQPAGDATLVITTSDEDGNTSDRVVSRLESGGNLYVAANHWPRAWYERALQNPAVEVTQGGEKVAYMAVPVTGSEHDQVNNDHKHGVVFLVLTGFPPRYFLRLDPAGAAAQGT